VIPRDGGREGDRYPFPAYANGWFRVAYSNELAPGEVVSLSYFGRELVVYRDEAGQAHVMDAHCPHLGAHLGVGGRVEGDSIRCPFHAWKFGPDGRCNEIPYARRIPPNAAVKSWPVMEENGIVFTWYHADDAAPTYAIPRLEGVDDPAWRPLEVHHWKLRARWLDMNENCVDAPHFHYVHGVLQIPTSSVREDEHVFEVTSTFTQKAPGGTAEAVLTTCEYGPGFQHVSQGGLIDSLLMNTATPIDEEYTDVSFAYSVKTEGDPRKEKLAVKVVQDLVSQFENDMPIWENKACWRRPTLCDGDGPVGQYRRWYQQFF
jgi:phenylpropionate dioxygenase-like ring-hydroxylating dioxygenase large terminal subunit